MFPKGIFGDIDETNPLSLPNTITACHINFHQRRQSTDNLPGTFGSVVDILQRGDDSHSGQPCQQVFAHLIEQLFGLCND